MSQYGYLSFTYSSNVNNVKLKHNIDPNDNSNWYVSKNVLIDKRIKFGSKEFKDLRIQKDDKTLINSLKKKVTGRLIKDSCRLLSSIIICY